MVEPPRLAALVSGAGMPLSPAQVQDLEAWSRAVAGGDHPGPLQEPIRQPHPPTYSRQHMRRGDVKVARVSFVLPVDPSLRGWAALVIGRAKPPERNRDTYPTEKGREREGREEGRGRMATQTLTSGLKMRST